MPMRLFRNTRGVLWQVWSVVPGTRVSDERRRGRDRRSPEPVFRYTGPERRGADRRRVGLAVSTAMAAGWLTFQSDTERRRLVPIPPGWETLSEPDLGRLCDQAAVVPVISGRSLGI